MQAEINVGTVGHVDHGKSTLVYQLTGKKTDSHSEEIKRGITIKLGYADTQVHKCTNAKCGKYSTKAKCAACNSDTKAERLVSFVDAPGHETLMATVIAASSIMDGALFVIAANEKCPQPQTAEHLMILQAAKIPHVIIVQNKADLVTKERAKAHAKEIREFLKDTPYALAPIIPTAANTGINIDALLEAIQKTIPTPKRDPGEVFRMHVVRSFDVNKPGTGLDRLVGAVLGGAVRTGAVKVGDQIQILPGILKQKKNKETYEPLTSSVLSLNAGTSQLEQAGPGGLIALSTNLDPSLAKADALVGCQVGRPGTLPEPSYDLTVEITPMPRLLSVFPPTLAPNEPLVLGVGTATTVGFVQGLKKKTVQLKLKKPVCVEKGDLVAVMRRSDNRWRVYGVAHIV
ncbi:translation initiation factor IF-2 subunit gamma [Candidatus Micrarchaeota archaeon]|nr:translation initiation factor IF-2 subunit gamma [Candidatus Micrarchaeota archaeon]